jgi:glycosyltransferase involved in cell wall biosynthesis
LRILFLVERPTQFEAPFFRFAARDPRHELRVLFTGAAPAAAAFDPELGHTVSWGIDLLGGYPHAVAPARGRARWLAGQLGRRRGGGGAGGGACDLLIANGYTRPEYLLAAVLARRAGIATALRLDSVLWPDDAAAAAPPRTKRLLYSGLLLRLYDLFLGVGSLTLAYLAACGVPAPRRGLLPYAVDVEHFRARSRLSAAERAAARARLDLPPAARAVLAVAKLNPREAPWDLLGALPRLPPDARLLVAGDGPARADLERLAAATATGRVKFLGYVPYPELPALYAAADLFVHAAREERWGVSVAEALACGLPVVASSRVGAGHDLLAAGANGWLYPAGDAAELARRIAQALALDRQAVAAASREILGRWDYAAAWRQLLDAAGRIVGGSAP